MSESRDKRNEGPVPHKNVGGSAAPWLLALRNFAGFASLRRGTDRRGTIESIDSQADVRGYHFWILICSCLLACLGLDTNSAAVIIGAMLISPLMNPILGVGLGLGIRDKELFAKSLRALSLATAVSIGASTLYFFVSPLGEPTQEILSRTHPTLLDVLIAFFGGLAGVISGSRDTKTNAIPGVAIATALMPPVCTAGFGLAKGRWDIFLGAFYLFFINAVFISLATYLMVKYLRFPLKDYSAKQGRRIMTTMTVILLVLVVAPSGYFLFNAYRSLQTQREIERFLQEKVVGGGEEVLKWEIVKGDSLPVIKVLVSGANYRPSHVDSLEDAMAHAGLSGYRLRLYPVSLTREEVAELSSAITREKMHSLELQMKLLAEKAPLAPAPPPPRDTLPDPGLLARELRIFYPEIAGLSLGRMAASAAGGAADTGLTVVVEWTGGLRGEKAREADSRIREFMRMRIKDSTVTVIARRAPVAGSR